MSDRQSIETTSQFELVTSQIQYWAEIGTVDGGGMGRMISVEVAQPFPTKAKAEAWLDAQGWKYDERMLRRHKPGVSYGLAHVRRVEERDHQKWR